MRQPQLAVVDEVTDPRRGLVAWCAVLTLLLAPSSGSAEIIQKVTPEIVKQALAACQAPDVGFYRVSGAGGTLALFTTPFSRVALACRVAREHYRVFTEADVTEEMTAPVIEVYGLARVNPPGYRGSAPGPASVVAVALVPAGSRDPRLAIQPVKTERVTNEYKNQLGATWEAADFKATFPLDAIHDGLEVRVVYDRTIGPAFSSCTDCGGKLKLATVR